jgi:hypothetical protein
MPLPSAEMIEKGAIGIFYHRRIKYGPMWDELSEAHKDIFRGDARAVLAATIEDIAGAAIDSDREALNVSRAIPKENDNG